MQTHTISQSVVQLLNYSILPAVSFVSLETFKWPHRSPFGSPGIQLSQHLASCDSVDDVQLISENQPMTHNLENLEIG